MRAISILLIGAASHSGGASAFAPPSCATHRALTPSGAAAAGTAQLSPSPVSSGRRRSGPFVFGDVGVPSSSNGIDSSRSSTALGMYNLPPSGGGGGGGGGGPVDQIKAILPGVLTILGLVAFFMSPLGSVFFFLTNSLLAVSILTPVILFVGFQVWQFFYTTEGPCPSCGAPIRTLKDDGGNPTICFNCGSLVRTTVDGDGFELCNDPGVMMEQEEVLGGLFGDLFGGGGGYGPGDVFTETTTVTTTTTTTEEDREDKRRRQRTVIDVDVERD